MRTGECTPEEIHLRKALSLLVAAAVLAPAGVLAQKPAAKPSKAEMLTADLFLAITHKDINGVRAAVKAGASPNERNWLGFTPLTYASFKGDLEIAKFLIGHGARINDDTTYGSALSQATVSASDRLGVYLLDHGANPNPPRYDRSTPLMVAASNGSVGIVNGLLKRKVDPNRKNDDDATALTFAARSNQPEAVKLLLAAGARVNAVDSMKRTPLHYAAMDGFSRVVSQLIQKGASINAVDATGATPLQLAARYSGDAETVRSLLRAGADAGKQDGHGKTPYEIASQRGYVAATEILKSAPGVRTIALSTGEASTTSDAIKPAISSIQIGMKTFEKKAACTSCHHQGLGLMTLAQAAQRKVEVDGKLIGDTMGQLAKDGQNGAAGMHAAALDSHLIKLLPGVDIGDFVYAAGYFLNAARANGVPANPGFADVAQVIGRQQKQDGSWRFDMQRGTMQHSNFTTTAMALEVVKAYWPADKKAELDRRMAKAQAWLTNTKPQCAEDMASRVWGLKVTGANAEEIATAAKQLMNAQRTDGGWGFPNVARSDAYTTGISLYALRKAAEIPATSEPIRRAVKYLIRTQDEDGTWYVAKATQAYNNHFDASFPHGYAQYASFAGTCWAVLGLLETMEDRTASR